MHFLFAKISKYPKVVVALVVALTIIFGIFAGRVGITTDIKSFFPAEHPEVIAYDEIAEKFGGSDRIMVAFTTSDVFTLESLKTIEQITHELAQVPGVVNVRSLTSIEEIASSDWGVDVMPLIGEIPEDETSLELLRQRVLQDEMYVGTIVSANAKNALHVAEVDPSSDAVKVALAIRDLLALIPIGDGHLYLTGTPVLNAVLADSMQADLMKLFPIVLLLVAIVLYLYFRNLRGVILPFITILISVIWTLGLMGILGKQLSPLNAVMPVLLVSLGSAYGIYLIARYNDELIQGASREVAVEKTLKSVGISVLLAGTTTIAGFASNLSSKITLMKDFGLFTAYGVLVALVISLTFIPAMLLLLKVPKKVGDKKDGEKQGLLPRVLSQIASFVVKRKSFVLSIAIVVLILAILGVPRLETDSNFFNFFSDDTEPKIAYEMVKENFSGSESIEIVITGDLLDPLLLKAMQNLQNDLEKTGLVGSPQSIVNILERVNMALNEGDLEYKVLPSSRELVAQYLLLMEMSGGDMLEQFLTLDYGEARIQAMVRDSSSDATARLFNEVDALYAKHFKDFDTKLTQTGIIALLNALASMIITGQISSLFTALATVFVIVFLLLRSWEGSFFSTAIVGFTILINFGLMGWLRIPLDIVTVLISSIGIGVGVDYSIHIYTRYQEESQQHQPVEAVTKAIIHTGKSIVTNAGSVIAGFLILLLSSFPPFRYFGSLVTGTMLVASVSALTILPALILFRWERKNRYGGISVKKTFVFVLVFQVILGLVGAVMAADLSADQILVEVDKTMSSESKIMTQEMTLVSATGQERTREVQLQNKRTKQKESMLVRFLSPSDVRGTGLLMDDDDTWLYLPALGKSRRIAGHAKKGSFMGSDLSYDDMQQLGMTGFSNDYTPSLVGTEELKGSQTFVLELLPRGVQGDYSKLVMWVDQKYFLPRQIEYFDLTGKLLKVLHNDGLQEIDGRWLASTMEMSNVQTGTKTLLRVFDVEFDLEIPDSQFTIRSLERGL